MIKREKGWTLKEVGLLATVIVTTIGGIATCWTLYSSFSSSQQTQSEKDIARAQNFANFRTETQDKLGYLQDQVNWLMHQNDETRQDLRECHK